VELEPGRPAFIATSELKTGGTPKVSFHPAWQVMPPVLVVKAPSVIDGSTVTLKGQVTDDVQVKDLFVRVYNKSSKLPAKKVFYLPNRVRKNKLPFSADVPLWPGSNIIQVFARETTEVQSVATLIVMRKSGPSVAQAPLKDNGSATGTKRRSRTAVLV
jgi:carboxyl-terminal processing protease